MIEMLEAESRDLKKNLSLAESRQNKLKDHDITEKLEEKLKMKQEYEALIKEEQRKITELDRSIREVEKKINVKRKDMGG